jgi:lauroyl/myristoyl acyltransferase
LPAQLGLKYKCKIYLAWVSREEKSTFNVEFYSPLNMNNFENNDESIQRVTNEINQFFEKKISENPGQYFWLHDRWKT